jgi:hypothetical protein
MNELPRANITPVVRVSKDFWEKVRFNKNGDRFPPLFERVPGAFVAILEMSSTFSSNLISLSA